MIIKKVEFTKEGFEKMQKRLEELTEKRKQAIVSLQTARELGDLSENGAYKAARWELGGIDRELRRLKYFLRVAKVVEKVNNDSVDFGNNITVENEGKELTFTLVSSFESDPTHHKLSINSPIGKAVLGKKVGDKISVNTPSGLNTYIIKSIK
ncbi:MAG: Transcription elongation factor GreA [Candidatus Gottesmanbacteria bacterium GW2011_GWC2_39_8]|uniref:Transcription elongation factor GreA n=1 Tax=Candidatus Gottesmanbacteria bacterium GW2011_GWC2_39_8 TaxID=1618450 RepID=A0A0G0SDS1_9BACT|nr:MAG: Transcription elongation factor GreA [Candidatus Gottesmanbacteria bacterium GW2011_GWC2_39_8]